MISSNFPLPAEPSQSVEQQKQLLEDKDVNVDFKSGIISLQDGRQFKVSVFKGKDELALNPDQMAHTAFKVAVMLTQIGIFKPGYDSDLVGATISKKGFSADYRHEDGGGKRTTEGHTKSTEHIYKNLTNFLANIDTSAARRSRDSELNKDTIVQLREIPSSTRSYRKNEDNDFEGEDVDDKQQEVESFQERDFPVPVDDQDDDLAYLGLSVADLDDADLDDALDDSELKKIEAIEAANEKDEMEIIKNKIKEDNKKISELAKKFKSKAEETLKNRKPEQPAIPNFLEGNFDTSKSTRSVQLPPPIQLENFLSNAQTTTTVANNHFALASLIGPSLVPMPGNPVVNMNEPSSPKSAQVKEEEVFGEFVQAGSGTIQTKKNPENVTKGVEEDQDIAALYRQAGVVTEGIFEPIKGELFDKQESAKEKSKTAKTQENNDLQKKSPRLDPTSKQKEDLPVVSPSNVTTTASQTNVSPRIRALQANIPNPGGAPATPQVQSKGKQPVGQTQTFQDDTVIPLTSLNKKRVRNKKRLPTKKTQQT